MRAAMRRSHPGQAVAEFALVITPCLTLFFGVINFALALYCYDFVCYSAQQAVRYATVHGSTATTIASSTDVHNYVNTLVVGVLKGSVIFIGGKTCRRKTKEQKCQNHCALQHQNLLKAWLLS